MNARTASVFGSGEVNGERSVQYRVDVTASSAERGHGSYRIRLSNGYDSGVHKLQAGHIHIKIGST